MTEDDVTRLSDEQLRSLASRTRQELTRREELLKQNIRAAFDARLAEVGLKISDIYPDAMTVGLARTEKKHTARMIARAFFMMK